MRRVAKTQVESIDRKYVLHYSAFSLREQWGEANANLDRMFYNMVGTIASSEHMRYNEYRL
jgi:hypothetical protein